MSKEGVEKEGKLRFQDDIKLIVSPIDPENPLGVNFTGVLASKKIKMKYQRMRKHVNISEEEGSEVLRNQLRFGGKVAFIGVTGSVSLFAVVNLMRAALGRPIFQIRTHFSYLLLFFVPFMLSTFHMDYHMHVMNTYYPLLQKYTEKAVKKGFQDYRISGLEDQDKDRA